MNTSRVALLLALSLSGAVSAAVQETSDQAFTMESVVLVEQKPDAAWRALVRPADWWDPSHTWSGSARNLSLQARAGGCFCEKLAGGGSIEHARVISAQPGRSLRLNGGLGPLQEMAAVGVLTFTLAPDGLGTRITMTYRVSGTLTLEPRKLAPLVDQVMTGQLERLRDRVNRLARR